MKKRVLVFCDFYLPGSKSGGGMWTIVNLVDRFHDRYDFYIVTRNYESKGETTPYTTVKTGEWNTVRNAQVFYLGREHHSLSTFVGIVKDVRPDAVFLNSAFSMPVVRFLTVRRKKMIGPVPVILAPCGEFSSGALSIKPLKKKLFLAYAKALGLYDSVTWKASFAQERDEIRTLIGENTEVMIAADLAPKTILPDFDVGSKPLKTPGSVKLLFLSRITRKKNLLHLIETLSQVTSGEVTLDVLGPLEDNAYWDECTAAIDRCPGNICVNAEADFIPYETGLKRMMESHFFVLPTLGENFGYVFLEAMAAGSPLLVSDRTSWDELEARGAGRAIPLEDRDGWVAAIENCVEMDDAEFRRASLNARNYAMNWLGDPETEAATARVMEGAILKRAAA